MKFHFLTLFLLLLTAISFAGTSAVRDASSTNIPTTYGAAGGTLLSGAKGNKLCCDNVSVDAQVDVCFSKTSAADCGIDWILLKSSNFCFDDEAFADNVFIRVTAGAVSAGFIQCRKWVRN